MTKKKYTYIICHCGDDVRKTKGQNELRLMRNAKTTTKGFLWLCQKKAMIKEVVCLLQGGGGGSGICQEREREKAELLGSYSAPVISYKGNVPNLPYVAMKNGGHRSITRQVKRCYGNI